MMATVPSSQPPEGMPPRTASADHIDVAHPTPEISALQASVDRLERSAEELSQGGSDIGDEIRKLHLEQEAASAGNSRRSSVVTPPVVNSRSRGASTSSYTNSIIDLNHQARRGGYSPAGFVGSPSVSLKSGNRSRAGTVHRVPSNGAAMKSEHVQEGRPLESPIAPNGTLFRQASQASTVSASMLALDHHIYDTPPQPSDALPSSSIIHDHHSETPETFQPVDFDRPARPISADTSHQANTLFHDFDGVHFSPTHEEFVHLDDHGAELSRVPMEKVIPEEHEQERFRQRAEQIRRQRAQRDSAFDPATHGMTYYPAPVPRMLNLPKKLSQASPTPPRAVRRSQVTSQIPDRKSSAWIPALDFQPEDSPHASPTRQSIGHGRSGSNSSAWPAERRSMLEQRRSMMSLRMLPPHLRASVFFDQQPSLKQEVEIQHESAVATLDSILAASATAPVNVFTDHPLAGRNPNNFYKTERTKKPAAKMLSMHERAAELNARRISELPRTRSEVIIKTGRRNSMASVLTLGQTDGKKLTKRSSRLSLSAVEDFKAAEEAAVADESAPPTARLFDEDGQSVEFQHEEQAEDSETEEPTFTQPTTLLAELQMRKVQQKSRNRTAATAFPNGMHSTLLELDAVAQIEKQKRKKHKVALAWEEQPMTPDSDEEDADVPLAVLFNSKKGLPASMTKPDSTRAIGLMERRQMEDNEPLSSRRNRILGINTRPRNSTVPALASPAEDDDIPLAERRRRVKQRDALNSALGDISGNRKSTFSEELMSQFGEPKSATSGKSATTAEGVPEAENVAPGAEPVEETLGQRRARLQKERAAGAVRPPMLRSPSSLANLLAVNPIGQQDPQKRTSLNAGGLLSQADCELAENKDKLRERLIRGNSSSHLLHAQARVSGQSLARPDLARNRNSSQTLNTMPVAGSAPWASAQDQARQSVQLQILQQQQQQQQQQQRQSLAVNPLAYMNFVAPQQQQSLMYDQARQMGLQQPAMGFNSGMINAAGQTNGMAAMGMGYGRSTNGMGMNGMNFGMHGTGAMGGMGMFASPTTQTQHSQYLANMMRAAEQQAHGAMGPLVADPTQRAMIDRWRSSVAQ